MKYRLKDGELQKRLDALSDGSFSRCLDAAGGLIEENPRPFCFGKDHKTTGMPMFGVWLCKDDIEEEQEYNPLGWNKYPDVKPPIGVLMRTECLDIATGEVHTFLAKYIEKDGNHYWTYNNDSIAIKVDRYRPWEE